MNYVEKELECGCRIMGNTNRELSLEYCPKHRAAPDLYKALLAVYTDIELQNVEGGSDELNIIVQEALENYKEEIANGTRSNH